VIWALKHVAYKISVKHKYFIITCPLFLYSISSPSSSSKNMGTRHKYKKGREQKRKRKTMEGGGKREGIKE
jgi:hypothetical protein